jgi:hypothetical protein
MKPFMKGMAEPAVSKLSAAGMASGNHGWGTAATAGHSHCGRGDAHCGNSRCRDEHFA